MSLIWPFGASLVQGLILDSRRTGCGDVLARLSRGEVGISVGGAMSDVFSPILLKLASVQVFTWDRPHRLPPTAQQPANDDS